jgi:hypothetical protein
LLLYDKNRAHVEQRGEAFTNDVVKAGMLEAPTGYFQAEGTARAGKSGPKSSQRTGSAPLRDSGK